MLIIMIVKPTSPLRTACVFLIVFVVRILNFNSNQSTRILRTPGTLFTMHYYKLPILINANNITSFIYKS